MPSRSILKFLRESSAQAAPAATSHASTKKIPETGSLRAMDIRAPFQCRKPGEAVGAPAIQLNLDLTQETRCRLRQMDVSSWGALRRSGETGAARRRIPYSRDGELGTRRPADRQLEPCRSRCY